jgi:hypothetical protein
MSIRLKICWIPDFDTHVMNTDPEVVLVYIAIHKNTIFIVINIVCIFCNEVSMIYKEKKLIIEWMF